MRTTLDIDDDVLRAAKELASLEHSTAGRILSDLARKALEQRRPRIRSRNGVPLLPHRDGERPVTPEDVTRILDQS